jgi:hypothetical protein
MHDYLHTKKEEDRRRKERKMIVIASSAGCVVVCAALVFMLRSPMFRISSVSIDGAVLVDENAVRDELYSRVNDQGWLSRVLLNRDSILRVGAKELEGDLLGRMPSIREIAVHKNLFKRSVSISLQERERFGLWCPESEIPAVQEPEPAVVSENSTSSPAEEKIPTAAPSRNSSPCWWFDKEGIAFLEGPRTQGHIIPKVVNRPGDAKIGDRILPADQMQAVLSIFDFLDVLKAPQRSLAVGRTDLQEAATQSMASYPTLRFSFKEDPHFALPVLEQMRGEFKGAHVIDLRVHDRIYYE